MTKGKVIQIGLFIKKCNDNYNQICYNFKDTGIIHSNKFKTDIQYYFLKENDLIFLNLSFDIINNILEFLPNKNNTENITLNSNIFNLMSNNVYY